MATNKVSTQRFLRTLIIILLVVCSSNCQWGIEDNDDSEDSEFISVVRDFLSSFVPNHDDDEATNNTINETDNIDSGK